MLDYQSSQLNRVFHALSHEVRREVLRQVAQREVVISELAKPFDMTLEAVSQHIRVLERAGLVRRTRRGRAFGCVLEPEPLGAAASVLAELKLYWNQRLDALEEFVVKAKD